MIIWFEEICLQVFLWLLQLIDGIIDLFNALSGIDDVVYAGESVNIIESTLTNSTVQSVFWCIIILAVGLACIFTIVAVIKNMITSDKALSSIVGKFFLSILGTIAMLLVVVLGILIANELLRILSDIFRLNTSMKLSTVLFDACAGKWINGFSIKDFDVNTVTVGDLFGDCDTFMWFWPTTWQLNGMLDPSEFFYAPALIAVSMLTWQLLKALIAMARRLFEIVYCYFCMPVAMSTLPLDDGARFKNWTTAFLSKILLAFGCVLSVNIFTLLLPIFTSLTIPGAGSFENAVFMIILIVGGAMVIPGGQALFVHIFAHGEDRNADGYPWSVLSHGVQKFGVNAALALTGGTAFMYKAAESTINKYKAEAAQMYGTPDEGAYRDGNEPDYTQTSAWEDPFDDMYPKDYLAGEEETGTTKPYGTDTGGDSGGTDPGGETGTGTGGNTGSGSKTGGGGGNSGGSGDTGGTDTA